MCVDKRPSASSKPPVASEEWASYRPKVLGLGIYLTNFQKDMQGRGVALLI